MTRHLVPSSTPALPSAPSLAELSTPTPRVLSNQQRVLFAQRLAVLIRRMRVAGAVTGTTREDRTDER